jgi:hypothetical protein
MDGGCFSVASLNNPKIDSFAKAIDAVVRDARRVADEEATRRLAEEEALRRAKEIEIQRTREELEKATEAALRARRPAPSSKSVSKTKVDAIEAEIDEEEIVLDANLMQAIAAHVEAESNPSMQESEQVSLEEEVRKAAERAEVERRAQEILASIK